MFGESEIDGFSDDSDADDKIWIPPVSKKNIEEEEDEEEDIKVGQVSDQNIVCDIAQTPPNSVIENTIISLLHLQPQTPVTVANTGWVPMPFNDIQLPDQQYGPHAFKVIETASCYIEKYFQASHFDEAALLTNMYAMSKLGKELKFCANEIKFFYGAHAMISIIKYPRIHMYWQRGIQFDLISQAITRDRFF